MRRIPRAEYWDFRKRLIDAEEFILIQLELYGADVLFESGDLRCARNRHDPRLLCQQPCERDLRRRGVLPRGERLQPLDESEIRLPVVLRESRNHVAEVGRVEHRLFVDLAGEETLAEWAERHESDPQLIECGKHFSLRLSPPQ